MKIFAINYQHLTRFVFFAALTFSTNSFSFENFLSDDLASYPPGCATLNQISDDSWPAPRQILTERQIELAEEPPSTDTETEYATIDVQIIRQGCAESGRSVLIIGFKQADSYSPLIFVPRLSAQIDGNNYMLRSSKEPNTWIANESYRERIYDQYIYYFISGYGFIDASIDPELERWFDPVLYNSDFTLQIIDVYDVGNTYTVDIPAYQDELKTTALPINGRLAGNWVSEGAAFQGLLVSVNELTDGQSFFFLSWYTFGSDNKSLWMTASQFFEIGDTSVTMPIYRVEDQIFLGDNGNANVIEVGEITVQVMSCNKLLLTYQLDSLGLGEGAVTFTRLFDAAISGYSCRDNHARIESQRNIK